ncbi:MAG: class I SAM-dependent methyltransferase [Deltaproteobacteria bacterium]|nr:class I SAM-dependent methyltransferase [Deltaproteobacteria bacterium]
MLTIDFERLSLFPGDYLLDAGCGTGRHICHAFQNCGLHVVGVDTNEADLAHAIFTLQALSTQQSSSWRIELADIAKLPFPAETFDAIICSEVLEHIPDALGVLRELLRVLKRGGVMAISVPNFLPERICWFLSAEYHNEEGGHIRIYKKKELKNYLCEVGLIHEGMAYKHGLHSPYWWLKCLVGHKREDSKMVNGYKKFLEWDIIEKPMITRTLDRLLSFFIAKSIVLYARKPW